MVSKKYIKTRKRMKVTFIVDFAKDAEVVEIAGEFNDWQPQPLRRYKNGVCKLSLDLEPGRQYQYRYRIDGRWENDWAADAYVPNGLGQDNSVVVC
ncbi:MAG: glycoside hydrolase [Chloroflexi bacterium]|nr:MAG: glycoside hydrolase [Chloroflexota bacterium]